MIQITGEVKYPITLDSTTWIFDDRKVSISDLEQGVFDGSKPIEFDDNREWNRAILEGQTNPPTLNSEIKYKKRAVLEDSFVINMTPFFKNAEPHNNATMIRLIDKNQDAIDVPLDLLPYLFFQFAKDGKRLYEDNAVDSFVYIQNKGYDYQFKHITHIEVI
ncbi:hypothetical protein H6Y62_08610 [Staphylococcus lugdunensis]|uniref:Peptidyl-prolyl cis-trans isomerase n=1 Tax=Staphylococcus lugdunensis TaxID=28035 RepID=A0A133QB49_STALU|nr:MULTISPECIES: hypothetical protein [Staphylococcus]ADC87853.1 hypothetical protein SLGD_01763 [Staphylococcus lugdunensis HKU09-01]AMG60972.1 hypothetical protein AL499_03150 [Staphylococcus lugdunensis]AMG62847.1 hypothetical protein AL501_00740 [Staphylococcus lugdunensis]ARB78081.1 hypothetical protein A6J61_07130 [Staphylococcus lugdunensis]ARJ09604.1 hypothetical protein B7454_09465 [Staphylococcus lugdunensis]